MLDNAAFPSFFSSLTTWIEYRHYSKRPDCISRSGLLLRSNVSRSKPDHRREYGFNFFNDGGIQSKFCESKIAKEKQQINQDILPIPWKRKQRNLRMQF